MMELAISELTLVDGEPRILDLVLAERLGFAQPRMIRKLIERNKPELEGYGLIVTRWNNYRNRQNVEYWLNEGQALLVSVLSRTQKAAEVRRALIAIFTAWRRGELVGKRRRFGLTRRQMHEINAEAWATALGQTRQVFEAAQQRLIERTVQSIATDPEQ